MAVFAATSNPRFCIFCFATSHQESFAALAHSTNGRAVSTAFAIDAGVAPVFDEAFVFIALRISHCFATSAIDCSLLVDHTLLLLVHHIAERSTCAPSRSVDPSSSAVSLSTLKFCNVSDSPHLRKSIPLFADSASHVALSVVDTASGTGVAVMIASAGSMTILSALLQTADLLHPHWIVPISSAEVSIPDLSHAVMAFGADVIVHSHQPRTHLKSESIPSHLSIFPHTYSHAIFPHSARSDIAVFVISDIDFHP